MKISIEVSAEIQREAANRGIPVFAFVQSLIEQGLESMRDSSTVASAVDRIRALRKAEPALPAPTRGRLS